MSWPLAMEDIGNAWEHTTCRITTLHCFALLCPRKCPLDVRAARLMLHWAFCCHCCCFDLFWFKEISIWAFRVLLLINISGIRKWGGRRKENITFSVLWIQFCKCTYICKFSQETNYAKMTQHKQKWSICYLFIYIICMSCMFVFLSFLISLANSISF